MSFRNSSTCCTARCHWWGRGLCFAWEAQMFDEACQPRFAVKPGITGLWQVNGRSRLSMRRALELDVEYVVRRTFTLDLAILLRTAAGPIPGRREMTGSDMPEPIARRPAPMIPSAHDFEVGGITCGSP